MNQDVLICFVLDKSGSMAGVADATIEGANSFLHDQREQPGQALLSLTLFDTRFEVRYVAKPLAEVPPFDKMGANAYQPGGMTALFDAVGTTIKGTEAWLTKHPEFGGKVVVVTLTDGFENSSHEWHINNPMIPGDARDLNGLIQWKQAEQWQFVFLGAGGSQWLEKTFGAVCDSASFAGYDNTPRATVATYAGVSHSLTATRSTGKRFSGDAISNARDKQTHQ